MSKSRDQVANPTLKNADDDLQKKKYQKNTIDDIKELRSLVKTGLIKD